MAGAAAALPAWTVLERNIDFDFSHGDPGKGRSSAMAKRFDGVIDPSTSRLIWPDGYGWHRPSAPCAICPPKNPMHVPRDLIHSSAIDIRPCNSGMMHHIRLNKEICLHADHGCTGRCVEASQEGRCEFRPAFFFGRTPNAGRCVQWGLPVRGSGRLPLSFAGCRRRHSGRYQTGASRAPGAS
jgi:hypothetical protein